MNNQKTNVCLIISILALCLSIASIFLFLGAIKMNDKTGNTKEASSEQTATSEQGNDSEDTQYVLFLGTNDKDSNKPVYEPEEAKEILKSILIDRFGGYTIQEANGGWKDDDGTEYQEYTLVIYLSDTNIDDVHAVCDELVEKYNQSAVLIQSNKTKTEFYSGE